MVISQQAATDLSQEIRARIASLKVLIVLLMGALAIITLILPQTMADSAPLLLSTIVVVFFNVNVCRREIAEYRKMIVDLRR